MELVDMPDLGSGDNSDYLAINPQN
jgi:hypothetical protein